MFSVGGVEFKAVAVAFGDGEGIVEFGGLCAGGQLAGLGSQPHGASFEGSVALFVHHGNYGMLGLRIEFDGMGLGKFQDVSGEFDDGGLHAQAEAEKRHLVFTSVAHGGNFAFDASFAKSSGD